MVTVPASLVTIGFQLLLQANLAGWVFLQLLLTPTLSAAASPLTLEIFIFGAHGTLIQGNSGQLAVLRQLSLAGMVTLLSTKALR